MFAALALGALSMGGSLLQGIGAGQASKKQARMQMIADEMARQRNEAILADVNAKRTEARDWLLQSRNIIDVAENAGFNPVTFINAGGLGYLTDAMKYHVPDYSLVQASQVPQQHSMLSAFGGALSAGASAFGTQYRADQSYDLNMTKLENQADQFMMGLSSRSVMGGISTMGASSATRAGGISAMPSYNFGTAGGFSGGGGGKEKDVFWPGYEHAPTPLWKGKAPESTNPLPPSWGWSMPPGFANAEAYEDSMGELVSLPYGLWKGANAIAWNVTGNTIPGHFRQAKEDVATWKDNLASKYRGGVTPYSPFAGAYPSWATP